MPQRKISRKAANRLVRLNIPDKIILETRTRIIALNFDTDHYDRVMINSVPDLQKYLQNPGRDSPFRVIGFNDKDFFSLLAEKFKIHELTLEDVMNVYQRPKIEEIGDAVFAEVNRLKITKTNSCQAEQVSIFMREDTLLTFQDFDDDFFVGNRFEDRIKNMIRKKDRFCFLHSYRFDG